MKLAQDWIDAQGGEFKGDKACGCEPEHFAIQFSSTTAIDIKELHHESMMGPVKIPIDFKDDGSFDGSQPRSSMLGERQGIAGRSRTLLSRFSFGERQGNREEQKMHIDMEYPSVCR